MKYVNPNKALAHIDRLLEWKQGGKPSPVTLEWDLTNVCSLGCMYCHFAHTHVKGPWLGKKPSEPVGYHSTGSVANFDLVLRVLGEASEAGVQGVVWTGGGEPTLHPRWQDIVSAAEVVGLEQGMYTLGGHFTERSGRHLGRIAKWVIVSLDAADGETYAAEKRVSAERFQKACQGIQWLSGHNATIGVSFLLHAGNWENTLQMLALGRALGANYVTFRPTIEVDQSKPNTATGDRLWIEEAMPMLRQLATRPDVECDPDRFLMWMDWENHGYSVCHGIKLNATITPDGKMWVCPQRRGVEGSSVGDLTKESFAQVWQHHPGSWNDLSRCRAMCRLHLVNHVVNPIMTTYTHEAFV